MAKKKAVKELKEILRKELSDGSILIKFEDGSVKIIPAPIKLTADEVVDFFGEEEEEEEEEEEDSDDEDEESEGEDDEDSDEEEEDEDSDDEDESEEEEEEEEDLTPEALAEMDFEELEEVCDNKDLDTDPDDFDEDEVEKLRKAVAKELGITLPKPKKAKKSKK